MNRRRLLAVVSLIGLGALFLINPLARVMYRGGGETVATIAMRGFIAPLHMALMVGSVIGITELLRDRADRAGLTGGTLTVMGWAVGIRILALGQLESLLNIGTGGVPRDTLQKLFTAAPLVWKSIVPSGLLFPIGLITLGIALFATRPIPRFIGALLAVGGVLFPIGRIGNLAWALASCDVILGASLLLIGWRYASGSVRHAAG